MQEYGLKMVATPAQNHYDAVIVCVAHEQIKNMGIAKIRSFCKPNNVIFDVKYLFHKDEVDARL